MFAWHVVETRESSHYPLASQAGSATRHDERRRYQLLRLCCAPPSEASTIIHTNARSKRRRVWTAFFRERDVNVVVEFVLTHADASLSNQLKECEE